MANRFPQTILLGRHGLRRLAANPLTCSVQSTQKPKRMSSLSSPMFPQLPTAEPAYPQIPVPKGEEDFMSRHGGKVAAGALALTAAIIYTYYESGRSKTAVEEGLNNRMIIEPYEINEIRFLNNLTPAVYDALSVACLSHFGSSSSSGEQGAMSVTTTYPEFVSFVQKFLIEYNNAECSRTSELKNDNKGGAEVSKVDKGEFVEYKLVCGHLFDRLITEYALAEAAKNSNSDSESDSGSEKHPCKDITGIENARDVSVRGGDISVVDKRISVVYMLVALNMAVRSNAHATAEERVESLFKIAQMITNMKETTHHMIGGEGDIVGIQNEGNNSSINEMKIDGQGSGIMIQTEGDDNKNKDADSEGYITVDSAQQVVDHLIHSWQIPNEKRVGETGVRYPIKTYKEKSAKEMVEMFQEMQKPPHTMKNFTKQEFRDLLLGSHVCAWAECYRHN